MTGLEVKWQGHRLLSARSGSRYIPKSIQLWIYTFLNFMPFGDAQEPLTSFISVPFLIPSFPLNSFFHLSVG